MIDILSYTIGYQKGKKSSGGGSGGSVTEGTEPPDVGAMSDGEVYILLANNPDTRRSDVVVPHVAFAGQNQSSAINAFEYFGNLDGTYTWTTKDQKYNDLWIGADYQGGIVLNGCTVAPRTWLGQRQIYTSIFEASNDLQNWTLIANGPTGNEFPENKWTTFFGDNETAYRYYRLRTEQDSRGTINGSVTYTLAGIGFLYSKDKSLIIPQTAYYKKDGSLYVFM